MNRTDPVPERLLAVARELFTRRGFHAVSVREITSRARANLGAITYHFGSKEALYHAALESVVVPFADRVASAASRPGSPLERLEFVVRSALDHQPQHAGVPALLLRELTDEAPLSPPVVRLMKRNIGTIAGLIAEGQRDGSIRAGDPTLLALSVISQPFYFKIAGRGLEQALGLSPRKSPAWTKVVDHVVASVRRTVALHP